MTLKKHLEHIYQTCQGEEPIVVVRQGYFVSPYDYHLIGQLPFYTAHSRFKIAENGFQFLNDNRFAEQGIIIGKLYDDPCKREEQSGDFRDVITTFQRSLLTTQLAFISRSLDGAIQYLSSRKAAGSVFSQASHHHESMAIIIQHTQVLRIYLLTKEPGEEVETIHHVLQEITKYFTRLSGGIGFLQTGLLDTLWQFSILNHFYFKENKHVYCS